MDFTSVAIGCSVGHWPVGVPVIIAIHEFRFLNYVLNMHILLVFI